MFDNFFCNLWGVLCFLLSVQTIKGNFVVPGLLRLSSGCAETAFSASFLTVSRKAPCSHSRQTDVSMSIACRRPWAATINLCAEPPMGSRYGERLNLEPTHPISAVVRTQCHIFHLAIDKDMHKIKQMNNEFVPGHFYLSFNLRPSCYADRIELAIGLKNYVIYSIPLSWFEQRTL